MKRRYEMTQADSHGYVTKHFKHAVVLGRFSFPREVLEGNAELFKYVSKKAATLNVSPERTILTTIGPNSLIVHHGSTVEVNANISEKLDPGCCCVVSIDDVIQFDKDKPQLAIKLDEINLRNVHDWDNVVVNPHEVDPADLHLLSAQIRYRTVNAAEAAVLKTLAAKALNRPEEAKEHQASLVAPTPSDTSDNGGESQPLSQPLSMNFDENETEVDADATQPDNATQAEE